MKIAFIGGHGHHYLRNLSKHADLEPQFAVVGDGIDDEAARNLLPKLAFENCPAPLWFETSEALWDEFAPEIASIGAVYGHNGTLAARALERDIAVVCDKPVAANWAQLERLRNLIGDLSRDSERVLLTEFPFRALPEFRAAREAVQSGRIGEVVLASAQKSYRFGASRPTWYARREDYPGTLLWIASHGIDAIRFCGGVAFSGVTGVGGNLSQRAYGEGFEDHVVALFGLQNGGSAVVHADYLRPQGSPTHGDDRLRIAGTRGVVEVKDGRCCLTTAQGESDITDNIKPRALELEFLAAIRGESDAVYSTAESLEVAEILLRARDAQNATRWAKLSSTTD